MSLPLVDTPDELTPEWLSEALGAPVRGVTAERIGTGQIGSCYRLSLVGDGVPARVLAKLPVRDPAARGMLSGAYRTEVRFYTEIAPTVAVRVPACHYAAVAAESGAFVLLMEDISPSEHGDQITGCTPEQARAAVLNLAGLHGPRWCDSTLLDMEGLSVNDPDETKLLGELYGTATETFIADLGELLDERDQWTLRECVEVCEAWALARSECFALVHGDYRLDNLLFPSAGRDKVVAVDWQTLRLGLPARDLSYFLATGLPVEARRRYERDLVAAYHRALESHGVEGYSRDDCWADYRLGMIQGPLVSVFGYAYGTRSERGDRMFAVMVTRACDAIRAHDTVALARAHYVDETQ